ncbi:MAG: YlmC/YmxH family sporulation protein [Oscillospiraceae bacterium]
MINNFKQLKSKEIIDISDGLKVGYVDDVVIDTSNASVSSLVIYGRLRLLGLLGREDNLYIEWNDIEAIGEDTILIKKCNLKNHKKGKKINYLDKIFS